MATHTDRLWVVVGDFNWVATQEDRVELRGGTFTGQADTRDEDHWQETVAAPGLLQEMRQSEFTFYSSVARSRLDRVYTTHHTADFFSGRFRAVALPATRGLRPSACIIRILSGGSASGSTLHS